MRTQKLTNLSLLFIALLAAPAGACLGSDYPAAEGGVVASAPAWEDAEGFGTFIFYKVRPDFRDCLYPLCGGAFVKALNRRFTICADGSLQSECYVAVEDYTGLRLDPETLARFRQALYSDRAIVRGAILPREFEGFGNLGELRADEGWIALVDAPPLGTFWRLRGPEFECVTDPCFNIRAGRLNSGRATHASGVDFASVPGATPKLIELALRAMYTGALIATGENRVYDEGPGGVTFEASQLYLRIASAAPRD